MRDDCVVFQPHIGLRVSLIFLGLVKMLATKTPECHLLPPPSLTQYGPWTLSALPCISEDS